MLLLILRQASPKVPAVNRSFKTSETKAPLSKNGQYVYQLQALSSLPVFPCVTSVFPIQPFWFQSTHCYLIVLASLPYCFQFLLLLLLILVSISRPASSNYSLISSSHLSRNSNASFPWNSPLFKIGLEPLLPYFLLRCWRACFVCQCVCMQIHNLSITVS